MTDDEESPRHRSSNNSRAKTRKSASPVPRVTKEKREKIKPGKHHACTKSENNYCWKYLAIQCLSGLKFTSSLNKKKSFFWFWVMRVDNIVGTNIQHSCSLKHEAGRDEHGERFYFHFLGFQNFICHSWALLLPDITFQFVVLCDAALCWVTLRCVMLSCVRTHCNVAVRNDTWRTCGTKLRPFGSIHGDILLDSNWIKRHIHLLQSDGIGMSIGSGQFNRNRVFTWRRFLSGHQLIPLLMVT